MENVTPTQVIEPEVLPPQRGPVRLDLRTSLCSPYFWLLLGLGAGLYLGFHLGRKKS
jgi:hypothetical protein